MENRFEAKILQCKKGLEPTVEAMQQKIVKIQTDCTTKLTNINTLFVKNVSENTKVTKDFAAQKDLLKSLDERIQKLQMDIQSSFTMAPNMEVFQIQLDN